MREAPTHTWRGASADERRAQRRERLLAAGLEVIGTRGWAGTTVRAICAESGLTERYYYEAFSDRDALLLDVFERVREQTMTAVARAAADSAGQSLRDRARACIAAGLAVLLDDPRKGRVMFTEATSHPLLQQRRHDDLLQTARLLGEIAEEHLGLRVSDRADAELNTIAIVGAESAMAAAYLAGRLTVTRDRLIDHITDLHLAVVRLTSRPD